MVLCAAFGCNSRSDSDKISFFQFPKDEKLRKRWIDKLNRGATSTKKFVPTHHKLCAKHFEESEFVISVSFAESIGFSEKVRPRLKDDAVPTIFQYPQPGKRTCERQSATRIKEKKIKHEVSLPVLLIRNEINNHK